MDLTYGHVMPQAPEMEKAVLGALMIDNNAYLEVCDLLKPEISMSQETKWCMRPSCASAWNRVLLMF